MPLMERLRSRAARDQRSLNREAIWLLEHALEPSGDPAWHLQQERRAQLGAWKALAGRWQGSNEETDELVEEIYQARTLGSVAAERVVQEQESITLKPEDFHAFLDAIDTPAEPNAALRRAMERHAEQVGR